MVAPFRTTGVLLLAFLALLSTCTPLPLPLPLPQPMRSGTPASTAESSSAKSAANRPVEKWVREHPAEALATTAAGSAVLALLGHAGLSSFANFASEREAAIARRVPRAWGNVSQADRALENLRHLLRKDQETGNGEFGRCFRAQLSSLSLAQEVGIVPTHMIASFLSFIFLNQTHCRPCPTISAFLPVIFPFFFSFRSFSPPLPLRL
jgi:hypothetical protein